MTTPTELSEAHLQDHEMISAALEASSLSPRPSSSSSSLPPFLTSTTERFPVDLGDHRETPGALQSPVQPSPDLLTTPRTDSSRPLSSPPKLPNLSLSASNETRNTVKFTLLKKDSSPVDEGRVARPVGDGEERTDGLEERFESISARGDGDEERTESQAGDGESSLDPVLFAALNHHRDRFLLLRAEVELERFLANSSMTRLPLAPPYFQPALNSYQRLLVHRLADTFGITREVEAAPPTVWNAGAINPATGQPQGVVVLVKGENTRLPPAKLATYAPAPEIPTPIIPSAIAVPSPSSTPSIASSPVTSAGPSASTSSLPNLVDPTSAPAQQPTAPQILKILPRSGASRTASSASSSIGTDDDPATSSSAPTSSKGKGRRELTLEEREAAYKEARERIFSQPEQERSAPALPSSSSVASEDIGSRLASAGAGITRPSSAGSTFSRSSAALSVTGGRPSPSVASESGSSMWSGHHGGIYGGGSQLMPSLRHSAATFDPSSGWSQDYGQQYTQDSSWQHQHQQYQPHYSQHPPIQVTAPPAHSPYSASSPPYASSSTSSISGHIPPPLQFPPPSSQPQSQYGPVDAWGRNINIPPPLPSPSLSNSSGNSIQRPPNHQHLPSSSSTTPSERSTSASSGYLMRFADTGAVVTPGGTVTAGPSPPSFPSPASSMFVGPPSTTRSVSSFSSTSQQSLSSGGTSRTAASSSAGGGDGGGISRNGIVGSSGSQARRPSGSLASSISSVRSVERKGEVGSGAGSGTDTRKRDRQTTIRRQSPSSASSEVEQRQEESKKIEPSDENSSLHPSLPAKPVWVASKPPRPRSPPLSSTSLSDGKTSGSSAAFSSSSPSNSSPYPPSTSSSIPPPSFIENSSSQSPQPLYQPYPVQTNLPPPNFYAQSAQPFPPGSAPPPPPPLQSNYQQQGPVSGQQWSRPTGIHYPTAPSFVPSNSTPGQFPIGGGGASYPGNPQLPPPSWSYAHPSMPPSAPSATHSQQQQPQINSRDAMPFTDIRRPPPKSTQLFDPNRPNRGGSGSMRRGASGSGSVRSVSGTRTSLD